MLLLASFELLALLWLLQWLLSVIVAVVLGGGGVGVGCGCGRHRRVAAVVCEVVVVVVVVGNIDVDAAVRHMHKFTKLLKFNQLDVGPHAYTWGPEAVCL